jgi:large subunit ribosomal protein L4e
MAHRQQVNVQSLDGSGSAGTTALPAVFASPIRQDVVQFVHTNVNKNSRQAYAVNKVAGHQHSAESWGTGRAVSRIPRVAGSGTRRSAQGAFGNMCRKGRMFAPTKTWRKWHRRVNQNQRRFAVSSALAASALPALVTARGHRISEVPEFPLVVDNSIETLEKTSKALEVLAAVGADGDVDRCKESRGLRRGKGKMRNRRYVQRVGPLVIYADSETLPRAFRNLPGVETCVVDSLNLLRLAPGGHLGRFIVWSQAAFEKLNQIFGTYSQASSVKRGFSLPQPMITNPDLNRLINSDELQSVVRPAKQADKKIPRKKNALKNLGYAAKINPGILGQRRNNLREQRALKQAKARGERINQKRVAPAVRQQRNEQKKAIYLNMTDDVAERSYDPRLG